MYLLESYYENPIFSGFSSPICHRPHRIAAVAGGSGLSGHRPVSLQLAGAERTVATFTGSTKALTGR